jgi:hypothetical protein
MLLAAWVLLASATAAADARTEGMLQLLKGRPRGMSEETWRVQRREAARELGRMRERRAVPPLVEIVKHERFDVVLEVAIEALGSIGDRRAIEPLKALLEDRSLDAYVRDAAGRALRRLESSGARAQPGEPGEVRPDRPPRRPRPEPRPKDEPESLPVEPAPPPLPPVPPKAAPHAGFGKLPRLRRGEPSRSVLAQADQLSLVGASGEVRWDGRADGVTGNVGLGTRYRRQMEWRQLGFSLDGQAALGFDVAQAPGEGSTWTLVHTLHLDPEVRWYPLHNKLPGGFLQISAGANYGLTFASQPLYADRRWTASGVVSIGAGPGYGRILDRGPLLRLRWLERILRAQGLLKRRLPPAVARELLSAWYQLRNRIGSYPHLGHTLRILHQGGLLTDTPNPATIYRLVRLLDDPQLDWRPDGLMLRAGYGYARTLVYEAPDADLGFAYATARFARQFNVRQAFDGQLRFFYQMINSPQTYGVTLEAGYQHYLYNDVLDPLGSIGVWLAGGLNNQPGSAFSNGGLGYRVLGRGAYTRYFDRGSSVSVSLSVGVDTGSPLLLLSLEASYGIVQRSYVAPP